MATVRASHVFSIYAAMHCEVVAKLGSAVIASSDEETRPQLPVTAGHAANLVHQVGDIVEVGGRVAANHGLANDDSLNT